MQRLLSIGLASLALAALAGCGGGKTVTVTQTVTRTVTTTTTAPAPPPASASACTGGDLGGSFAVVPGSPGAGQISYTLTVTNTSSSPCFVSGLPQLQLLDAGGGALPTNVTAAEPGTGTAAKIVLQPGGSAKSDARFSPDVPGQGEGQAGQPCEPVAHRLQVTAPGGGTALVPITPPTSVCEHGSLRMSPYA
ncbi:MAG TPA: DUF4232 domain-containing protein [Gaiellaceae bacterium]|nr:DUF4232 domain-containing protein [Gaiellaceae bacterium]